MPTTESSSSFAGSKTHERKFVQTGRPYRGFGSDVADLSKGLRTCPARSRSVRPDLHPMYMGEHRHLRPNRKTRAMSAAYLSRRHDSAGPPASSRSASTLDSVPAILRRHRRQEYRLTRPVFQVGRHRRHSRIASALPSCNPRALRFAPKIHYVGPQVLQPPLQHMHMEE